MTNFEKATEIVANDIKHFFRDYKEYDLDTWADVCWMMGQDNNEARDDIMRTLYDAINDGGLPDCVHDDGCIEEADGSYKTYRQLINAVRKNLAA